VPRMVFRVSATERTPRALEAYTLAVAKTRSCPRHQNTTTPQDVCAPCFRVRSSVVSAVDTTSLRTSDIYFHGGAKHMQQRKRSVAYCKRQEKWVKQHEAKTQERQLFCNINPHVCARAKIDEPKTAETRLVHSIRPRTNSQTSGAVPKNYLSLIIITRASRVKPLPRHFLARIMSQTAS